jgi:ATP-dependent Lon protease
MKESATIALDYIQANAHKYEINSSLFKERDIHIHVPEGAVPKDGPSAGVAMTVAIISALTGKAVNSEVAMTGEVTLRGNVLAIGGLREKTLAALRSGIKTVIIPEENRKSLDDLSKEVTEKLTIVFMEKVDDALPISFSK